MHNDEFFNETYTEEICGEDYLPGTLESAYRQWKEKKKLEKLYGRKDNCSVNMIEEGLFHYLPYGTQTGSPILLW